VARALGVVDEQVVKHNEAVGMAVPQDRLDGVAYPGAFLLDEDGVVRERRFPPDVRQRESAAIWLEEGFGRDATPLGPISEVFSRNVLVRAWTDVAAYHPWQRFRLKVTIAVQSSQFLYSGSPEEVNRSLRVQVTAVEGLDVGAVQMPGSHRRSLAGQGEVRVYGGETLLTVPLMVAGNASIKSIDVTVHFQTGSIDGSEEPGELRLMVPIGPRP